MKNIFKHKKSIAVIFAIIIYFALTYGVQLQEKQIEKELIALDINKDGIYSDNEVTKEQKEAIEKVQNDSSRNFAPYTLIPFTIFCGLFIFFGLRAAENLMAKKQENN